MENLFAVMLDVSRNGVMKVNKVKEFIDYISIMGYNALELYSEDIYDIPEYPEFGYLRGKYSKQELQEMDSYAKSNGIELIPCIQTLAHFTNFKKTKRAADIIDYNDILLIDEEKTYRFLDALFKACADSFTSRNINIGMDEAYMVGLGKYLRLHGYQDRPSILLKHLKKVSDIAKKYGFKCHMWSDMFVSLFNNGNYCLTDADKLVIGESIKEQIPDNVSLTYWDYYSCDEKHYDSYMKFHKRICDNTLFAGGAHSWVGFSPANHLTLNSMRAAIKACNKNKINNIIVTMWGDNGKETSFFALLPSLFAISEYRKGNFKLSDIKRKFNEKFKLSYDDFLLLDSASFYKDSKYLYYDDLINRGPVFNDLFVPVLDARFAKHEHIDYLKASRKLKNAGKRNQSFKYLFNVQSSLCEFLNYKFDLSRELRTAYQNKDKEMLNFLLIKLNKAIKALDKFTNEFYANFLEDNKSFGMELHNIRMGGLKERLCYCKAILSDYLNNKIDSIPELEETIIDSEDNQQVCYQNIISPSDIHF